MNGTATHTNGTVSTPAKTNNIGQSKKPAKKVADDEDELS